ncbi:MAG TPA: helix-turn-helix domain-containing protein [Terriglobia bacterium]|nr:helix-turn-helix domain-containing protein [Terriglobia bacterium]
MNEAVEEKGNDSGLMTVPETASYLRLKISTIRAWVLKRRIPYVKMGGRVLIRRVDIQGLIEKSFVPVLSS